MNFLLICEENSKAIKKEYYKTELYKTNLNTYADSRLLCLLNVFLSKSLTLLLLRSLQILVFQTNVSCKNCYTKLLSSATNTCVNEYINGYAAT